MSNERSAETVHFKIKIGDKVEQFTSGFQGIVVGSVVYINGCKQHLVKPWVKKGKENEMPEPHWIDDAELRVVGHAEVERNFEPKGGPQPSEPPK